MCSGWLQGLEICFGFFPADFCCSTSMQWLNMQRGGSARGACWQNVFTHHPPGRTQRADRQRTEGECRRTRPEPPGGRWEWSHAGNESVRTTLWEVTQGGKRKEGMKKGRKGGWRGETDIGEVGESGGWFLTVHLQPSTWWIWGGSLPPWPRRN